MFISTANRQKTLAERLESAQYAAANPLWISTATDLARAAKAWSKCQVLALDTEFVRERTFYAQLGLLQISDATTVWLVDIPALSDLSPIAAMLDNPGITKLLHSCSEDLEIILQNCGTLPAPLFDSQVAAALCGESLQLGYEVMITRLLDYPLDKGPSRSNWLQRPLTDAQILYAGNDVAYLPLVAIQLQQRLQELDRSQWFDEEMSALIAKARHQEDPQLLYRKVKGAQNLLPEALAPLQALAAWRDTQAKHRDLPRSFVIKDQGMLELARIAVNTDELRPADISNAEALHPRQAKRHADAISELLNSAPAVSLESLPGRLEPEQRKMLKALQKSVANIANKLEIEPTILASKRILEQLMHNQAQQPTEHWFSGWRGQLLNQPLQEVWNAHY